AERDAAAVGRLLPCLDDLPHHRLRRRVADEGEVRIARGGGGPGGEDEGRHHAGQKSRFVDLVHRHGRQCYINRTHARHKHRGRGRATALVPPRLPAWRAERMRHVQRLTVTAKRSREPSLSTLTTARTRNPAGTFASNVPPRGIAQTAPPPFRRAITARTSQPATPCRP